MQNSVPCIIHCFLLYAQPVRHKTLNTHYAKFSWRSFLLNKINKPIDIKYKIKKKVGFYFIRNKNLKFMLFKSSCYLLCLRCVLSVATIYKCKLKAKNVANLMQLTLIHNDVFCRYVHQCAQHPKNTLVKNSIPQSKQSILYNKMSIIILYHAVLF